MADNSEGNKCECGSDYEHGRLVDRVNESFRKDYDRKGERHLSKPTSQSMRIKAKAATNGHGDSHTITL